MKFGNWTVNDSGIEWQGKSLNRFQIPADALLDLVDDQSESDGMYQWIIRATGEDWLTDDDLYDLNFAFVYLAGLKNLPLDYQLFDHTVGYQFDLLEEEDDDDGQPPLNDISADEAEAEQQRKDAMSERD
ncbi:MAG: hypothetical protein EOO04_06905 [Chitinophagaceae bacterium]|nr:MAG: hypothetical protein EOO04_06905 [Chitinophagaceae bacterium]